MTFTISLGWWLIPAIITILSWAKFASYNIKRRPGGDYDFGIDLIVYFCLACVISLIPWTVYFAILYFTK